MSRNSNNGLNFNHVIAIICILGAIILAANDKDGWGWLIFVALLVS